ncbi:sensor histidine kinase [Salmonella enterica subsp. enterica serovar Muenchen]|nr:sensor histidine kinase [Salmonella enterica subsp. enterica serovar Muenchen]EJM3643046.1 PhnD/SsuA/transferrin family substrate-binding protein [Salmonella enterica]
MIILSFSSVLHAESYQQRHIIRVGILSFDDINKGISRWQATIDYLNLTFPQYQFILVMGDVKTIDQLVANGTIDFAITNGVKLLQYQTEYNAVRMLSLNPVTGDPQHAIGSAVIARSDMPEIKDWSELKDKRIVATTPQAFGGYQIITREWVNDGITPAKDLSHLRFTGIPQENLLSQLINNEADIAVLPTCVLEQAIQSGRFRSTQFKVIKQKKQSMFPCLSSTPLYPHWTFSRMQHVHEQLASEIARSLLSIKAGDLPAVTGEYKGWTVPVNDKSVIALMQDIGLSNNSDHIKILWQKYRGWLFIALGYGLLLIGYHLRVSYLVKIRTRKLEEMMELNKASAEWIRVQQEKFYSAQRFLLSGEMAAGLAHELNQPLMAINNYVVGCRMRLQQQPLDIQSLDQALQQAIRHNGNAKNIIQRLRFFIKHHPEKQEAICLNDIISNALALFSSEIHREKVTVVIPESPRVVICADEILIQQVLVNLIRNGLDALKIQNSSESSPQITFTITESDFSVLLKILDNGVGLTQEQAEHLFVPFVTSKENGLGLGMAICKRIIEAHNGRIWAESVSEGACICIRLPLMKKATA